MIDLKGLTGGRYKIGLIDESWNHEIDKKPVDRRWYEGILCVGDSWIDIFSENPKPVLRFITTRMKVAHEIARQVPGSKLDLADGEAQVFFDPKDVLKVCRMAGARRKRQISEKEKVRLLEIGKGYRFNKKICGVDGDLTAQG